MVAGLRPPQQQQLEAFLSLVGCRIRGGSPSTSEVGDPQLFVTAHLLVSALAGKEAEKTLGIAAVHSTSPCGAGVTTMGKV